MGSSTQTPEEFDKEFTEKYEACVERAKNRCDEGISQTACTDYAVNRCETFLGTKENPINYTSILRNINIHFLIHLYYFIHFLIESFTHLLIDSFTH